VFTRSLSDALSLLGRLGAEHGFTPDDLSFAHIDCIHRLYASSERPSDVLGESIAEGRTRHRVTRQILLPPLLMNPADVTGFHQQVAAPNFITSKEAMGEVQAADPAANLSRSIVMLPNADPGYDWIFSRDIAGFITAYGGANSHMAVRACELGLPAVIGAGERLYEQWSQARRLRLDCLNRQVQILQ
jgi:phosphohistidine swiveling domain-containing protein